MKNQVEQDMIRRLNEYRAKSMQEDAELILALSEAARLILSVASKINAKHKYDHYPIKAENNHHILHENSIDNPRY